MNPSIQREENASSLQDLGEDRSLLVGLDQQLCITLCGMCLGQTVHGKIAESQVWKGRES